MKKTFEKGRTSETERVSVVGGDKEGDEVYNAHIDVSGVDEKKLIRKLDLYLVPWLSFLYLLSFLDRTSIGNAKVRVLALRGAAARSFTTRSCTVSRRTSASTTRSTTLRSRFSFFRTRSSR